jgi:hypothetical protein
MARSEIGFVRTRLSNPSSVSSSAAKGKFGSFSSARRSVGGISSGEAELLADEFAHHEVERRPQVVEAVARDDADAQPFESVVLHSNRRQVTA